MAHKPRRDRRRTSLIADADETPVVSSEPFESDRPIGTEMKTAAISAVTSEMMDDAAHKAADAVLATAHHAATGASPGVDEAPARPAIAEMSLGPHASASDVVAAEPVPPASFDLVSSPAGVDHLTIPLEGDVEPDHDAALDHDGVSSNRADEVNAIAFDVMEHDVVQTPVPTFWHDAVAPSSAVTDPLKADVGDGAEATVPETTPAAEADATVQGGTLTVPALPAPWIGAPETLGEPPQPGPSMGGSVGLVNAQVIEILASTMAATGQFLTDLMSARSVTEVVAANTQHVRRQMELMTTQGRQMTTLTRTIARDVMKPFGP